MKRAFAAVLLVTACCCVTPMVAFGGEKKVQSEAGFKVGNHVHLFHSGNVQADKEVAVGDVLAVYHMTSHDGSQSEVGQVKVLKFTGEHFFEGLIVRGNVKLGDIAQGSRGGYLVQRVM